YCEVVGSRIEYNDKPAVMGTIIDVTTDPSHALDKEELVIVEAIREITTILNSTLEQSDIMNLILENIGRVVPNDAANIMMLEEDSVRIAHLRGYIPKEAAALESARISLETPYLKKMLKSGMPTLISDTAQHSDWV